MKFQSALFLIRTYMKEQKSFIKSYRLLWWLVKNLPAMQESEVRSLDWENPLEKGMATNSSIPAWRIPWTEEPGKLQFHDVAESDVTNTFTSLSKSF